MDIAAFITSLLDLTFFVFGQHENILVLVPFGVLYFCFVLGLIKCIVYRRFSE